MTKHIFAAARLQSLLIASTMLVSSTLITSCAQSPEQARKHRQDVLEKFAADATEHLLDKNPETIQVSVNQLMHQQVHTDAIETLQKKKILPDSNIDVLRAIDEAQVAKKTNKVTVSSVKPLSSIDKEDVTFQVRGTEAFSINGKPSSSRPFTLELKCRLTKEMNDNAQIMDVNGMTAYAQPQEKGSSKSSRKRRRG